MHDFLQTNAAFDSRPPRKGAIAPPPPQQSFPIRVKVSLLERGMTMDDLANAIDRNRVTVSRAVNHGMHDPTRRLIAKYLGIAA